jgi:NAD(P)-dependent dehydrogenase (short-subunit alcohol dehydrogenase family)/signal transduction histidine kinase
MHTYVPHFQAGSARLLPRRVATLVAEGAPPAAVFDAVAAEMATLLVADGITLVRYEPDDELTVLAHRGPAAGQLAPGTRVRHDGASVSATVRRTQRPARIVSYADTDGQIGELVGDLGFGSGVGAPIVVDGRLWGATVANWTAEEPPPPGTEQRMAKFAQLLDTAIANADSRDQLTASRARLVTEAHEARRRVVRDLHDGAQQGLVHTIIALKLARRALDEDQQDLNLLVSEALQYAETANDELRELVHGILPCVLTREGLRAGVDELAGRTAICHRLAADGAVVAAGFSSNQERADELRQAIEADGGTLSLHEGNVGDWEDCQRVVHEVIEEHGRLDILVNNAGVTVDKPVWKMSMDDWHKVMRVNLSGSFYMSKPAIEHMLERGSGRIIYISSVTGEIGNIGESNYAASKSGLFGLTKTLAKEAALALRVSGKLEHGIGVTVNAVTPGLIETDIVATIPPFMLSSIREQIPMHRMGSRKKLPAWSPSWPRTPRATSPGRSGASTAESTCERYAADDRPPVARPQHLRRAHRHRRRLPPNPVYRLI